MIMPVEVFAFLILAALAVVTLSPLILLALWIADVKKGVLW